MSLAYDKVERKTTRLLILRKKALDNGNEDLVLTLTDTIVELNLQIVGYVSRQFKGRVNDMEDLLQAGNIGLIKAVGRFDLTRGIKFSTFATATIQGEMRRYIRDFGYTLRIPRKLLELFPQVDKAAKELNVKMNREPTIDEIAEHLGISPDIVIDVLTAPKHLVSLDTPMSDNESSDALLDTVSFDDKSFELLEMTDILESAFVGLTEKEKAVIRLKFWRGLTQTEIGSILGISQMDVSRNLRKALKKMNAYIFKGETAKPVVEKPKQKRTDVSFGQVLSSIGYTPSTTVIKGSLAFNLKSILDDFRLLCESDEFTFDEFRRFCESRGIVLSEYMMNQFSNRIIFPSRNGIYWRFEPDKSPVFSADVLVLVIQGLEFVTAKMEVA